MSLLSFRRLSELVAEGVVDKSMFSEYERYEHVNAASIDLVLGNRIMVEKYEEDAVIDMLDKSGKHLEPLTMGSSGYVVSPGEAILAHTVEIFHLPDHISGEYKLKSTQARNFFNHLNAGWADAGWNDSVLTLEFVNHNRWHGVRIAPGMKCGQMIFFEHEIVPADRSYAARGQYNGDKSVTAGKGLR